MESKAYQRIETLSNHLGVNETAAKDVTPPLKEGVDYYLLNEMLTESEKDIRNRAREFANTKIKPIVDEYYEQAKFPFELIEELKKLKWAGGNIKGYGCAELGSVQLGLIAMEFAKVSADIATFFVILQTISMLPIYYSGSQKQKDKYLPKMSSLESIGAFGLTEPLAGSDAAQLSCQAKKVDGGWILNGEKRWIGNAPFADIIIIWARDTESKKIKGFIVEKGTKGMTVDTINHKIALRMVQNGHIYLKDCFVKDDNQLPGAKDFGSGPAASLFLTRIVASWISVGIAASAYDNCLEYIKKRKQFGKPLAGTQIMQQRLASMLGDLQSMVLMCYRVSQLYEQGKLTYGQIGLLKSHNTKRGREIVSLAREMMGGNGIITDYGVAKNFVDMEAVHTFEGTFDVNSLIVGREITGISTFK